MNRTYFKRIRQTEPKPNRNLRLIDFRYHQETARQEKSEVYRSREYVAIFSFLLLHAYMYRSSNLDVAKRFFLVTQILKLVCLTCKVRLAYSKEGFPNNIFFSYEKKGCWYHQIPRTIPPTYMYVYYMKESEIAFRKQFILGHFMSQARKFIDRKILKKFRSSLLHDDCRNTYYPLTFT